MISGQSDPAATNAPPGSSILNAIQLDEPLAHF